MTSVARQKAEEFIIKYIDKMLPGSGNAELYKKKFATMTDAQFAELMHSYNNGEERPVIQAPNFSKHSLSVQRNLDIAKELGHDYFERVWIGSNDPDTPTYLTNNKYMIVELPIRRLAQLLVKKISTAENSRSIDQITGQPAGKESKTSKISFHELQIMRSMGLDESLKELIKYRGGDAGGFNAMNKAIARDGRVSLKAIEPYATGVESTNALKVYLTAMHLRNTL